MTEDLPSANDEQHVNPAGMQQHAGAGDDSTTDEHSSIMRTTITLTGTIVNRRSLGRCLAFCDISIIVNDNDDKKKDRTVSIQVTTIRKLVFRKHLVQGDNFPTKKAMLPYGAQLSATCLEHTINSTSCKGQPQQQERSSSSCDLLLFEVTAWHLLSHPHEAAVARASIQNGRGISCTDYLRSRREAYNDAIATVAVAVALDQHDHQQQRKEVKPRPKRDGIERETNDDDDDDDDPSKSEDSHGSSRSKALRSKIFAAWIVEHLLLQEPTSNAATEGIQQQHRILDVAGGKGQLAVELASLLAANDADNSTAVVCTTLDPLQRRRRRNPTTGRKCKVAPHFVTGSFVNYYPKNSNTNSKHTSMLIQNGDDSNDEPSTGASASRQQFTRRLVEQHTVLVGLHPDQCTEDILDVALAAPHIRAVAIVPCCVFPDLFQTRRLRHSQQVVRSYDQFLQYLLEKDPRLQQMRLPFDGKNECIYLRKSE